MAILVISARTLHAIQIRVNMMARVQLLIQPSHAHVTTNILVISVRLKFALIINVKTMQHVCLVPETILVSALMDIMVASVKSHHARHRHVKMVVHVRSLETVLIVIVRTSIQGLTVKLKFAKVIIVLTAEFVLQKMDRISVSVQMDTLERSVAKHHALYHHVRSTQSAQTSQQISNATAKKASPAKIVLKRYVSRTSVKTVTALETGQQKNVFVKKAGMDLCVHQSIHASSMIVVRIWSAF